MIIEKTSDKRVCFAALENGDVFYLNGDMFIKINESAFVSSGISIVGQVNAVQLQTYCATFVDADSIVEPVPGAKLIV